MDVDIAEGQQHASWVKSLARAVEKQQTNQKYISLLFWKKMHC